MNESELARWNPDVLRRQSDNAGYEPYMSIITPNKPAPIAAAGFDVIGPPAYHTSRRNMTQDLRGEAANGPLIGAPPPGAGISSLMGSVTGFDANFRSCTYQPPRFPCVNVPPNAAAPPPAAAANNGSGAVGWWSRVVQKMGLALTRR